MGFCYLFTLFQSISEIFYLFFLLWLWGSSDCFSGLSLSLFLFLFLFVFLCCLFVLVCENAVVVVVVDIWGKR